MKHNPPVIRYRISTTEFCKQAGLSNVTLWRKSKTDQNFPAPIYIGCKKLWYQDEVTQWLDSIEDSEPMRDIASNLSVEGVA